MAGGELRGTDRLASPESFTHTHTPIACEPGVDAVAKPSSHYNTSLPKDSSL